MLIEEATGRAGKEPTYGASRKAARDAAKEAAKQATPRVAKLLAH